MTVQTGETVAAGAGQAGSLLSWSRDGLIVGSLFGGFAGLVEAIVVAADGRRWQAFGELFGYAVLIDAIAFGLLAGLGCLVAAVVSRLLARRWAPAWPIALTAGASSLLIGTLFGLRWQNVSNPELLRLAAQPSIVTIALLAAAAIALVLVFLLAPRGGSSQHALGFARRLAPLGLGAMLVLATVSIVRDLSARGLDGGGASAPPALTPVSATRGTQPQQASRTPITARVEAVASAPDLDGTAPSHESAVPTVSATSATQRPPNVVLITIDSLRADHLGAFGHASARTPNLDRLAREGVRLPRAYTNRNGTTPAHASVFTGAYPSTHGVRSHMFDLLAPGVPTLAELLQTDGYLTVGMYSWLAFEPPYSGLQRGFQIYRDLTVNLPNYLANPRSATLAATYKRLKTMLAVPAALDRELAFSAEVEESLDGKADATSDAVILWLDEYAATPASERRPLFLWVHYWDPHYPFTPPAPFDQIEPDDCPDCPDGSLPTIRRIQRGDQFGAAETRRLVQYYDGEIAFTDQELGRLFQAMERLGLAENSVFAVIGDHGESLGELGHWLHGHDLLATEIHVPLIMRFPDQQLGGRTVDSVARSVDVMPTILSYLGLTIPPTVEGQSLLPLIRGEDTGQERYAIAELADRAIVSLVTREWQLLKNNVTGELRLYPVVDNRHGQDDLAARKPAVAAELEEILDQWQAAHP